MRLNNKRDQSLYEKYFFMYIIMNTYSYDKKKRLAGRIQDIRNTQHLVNIKNIIIKHNPDVQIIKSGNGILLLFHNLNEDTYNAIENYMCKIEKKKILRFIKSESETRETDVFQKITKN